jgi:hypothetical protein
MIDRQPHHGFLLLAHVCRVGQVHLECRVGEAVEVEVQVKVQSAVLTFHEQLNNPPPNNSKLPTQK